LQWYILGSKSRPSVGTMSQLNSLNKGNYVELVESYCEVLLAQHLESATVFKGTSKAIKNDIIHSIAMQFS
jgi:hypothetical protein